MADSEANDSVSQKLPSTSSSEKRGVAQPSDESDFHPISIASSISVNSTAPPNHGSNPVAANHVNVHQSQASASDTKSSDVSREEIIHTIFGDVGELINGRSVTSLSQFYILHFIIHVNLCRFLLCR
jgi:hypothetical protein